MWRGDHGNRLLRTYYSRTVKWCKPPYTENRKSQAHLISTSQLKFPSGTSLRKRFDPVHSRPPRRISEQKPGRQFGPTKLNCACRRGTSDRQALLSPLAITNRSQGRMPYVCFHYYWFGNDRLTTNRC